MKYSPDARVSEDASPPVPPCERTAPVESVKETASSRFAPRRVIEATFGEVGREGRSLNQELLEPNAEYEQKIQKVCVLKMNLSTNP